MASESKKKPVHFIFAIGFNGEFGYCGGLPWEKIPDDMRHFADVTTKTQDVTKMNAVGMGRCTWSSIPAVFRPLKYRFNYVLSSTPQSPYYHKLETVSSIEQLLDKFDSRDDLETLFIIGGLGLFLTFAQSYSSRCSKLYLTEVKGTFKADVTLSVHNASRLFRLFSNIESEQRVAAGTITPELHFSVRSNPSFLK